ncbi:MAG: hypothetical protein ABR905_11350 [Terracidiphilus sp.]|jgi:hypothetical protein
MDGFPAQFGELTTGTTWLWSMVPILYPGAVKSLKFLYGFLEKNQLRQDPYSVKKLQKKNLSRNAYPTLPQWPQKLDRFAQLFIEA